MFLKIQQRKAIWKKGPFGSYGVEKYNNQNYDLLEGLDNTAGKAEDGTTDHPRMRPR